MKSIIETKRAVDEIAMKLVNEFLDKKMITDLPQSNEVQLVFYVPMYKPKEESIQTLMSLANQVNVKTSIVVYIDYDPLTSIRVVEKLREISNISIFYGERHVGQLIATNVAGKIAHLIHGDAVYYALASDHDFWHPYFAQRAIDCLEEYPQSIIWIPSFHRIEISQRICKKQSVILDSDIQLKFKTYCRCNRPNKLQTFRALSSPSASKRILHSHKLNAGSWIYGVQRGMPLSELYLPVIGPDQIYLQRLLCKGPFIFDNSFEVWLRVQKEAVTRQRSIQNLFPRQSQIAKRPVQFLLHNHRIHHFLISLSLLIRYRKSDELKLVLLQFWILFRVIIVAKAVTPLKGVLKWSLACANFGRRQIWKLEKAIQRTGAFKLRMQLQKIKYKRKRKYFYDILRENRVIK